MPCPADFVAIDKVILPFASLIPSLSTKLSTDSVDKIEKYFVNRYLALMFRFHLKCMLHCMIIQQCFAALRVKPNACPAIVNFAAYAGDFCARHASKRCLFLYKKIRNGSVMHSGGNAPRIYRLPGINF